jgi:exodeoxyribonuclease-3
MRILTLNVNGLRAATRKGLFDWLPESGAEIACLQETRTQAHQRDPALWERGGYTGCFADARRPGYAGTAILARREPDEVEIGFGDPEFDGEGRLVAARWGPLWVCCVYFPSGSQGPERQASKDRFLVSFPQALARIRSRGGTVLAGDFNIAHRPIDLRNAHANEKHSGFLPHERAWMDDLFSGPAGFRDAFRLVDPDAGRYTFWSNRGRAYEKDVGWRIDYQVVTPDLAPAVRSVMIARALRFSDHAPLLIDYDLPGPL